jgi:transcription antitermination factor NusG
MSAHTQSGPKTTPSPTQPLSQYSESRWYAAYTVPRHEKCVTKQLQEREVECFLPLYRSIHRWKDRRKQVELPLFPGYVFVRIALQHRLRVLQLPGVVHFVSFHGRPAPLLESEINGIRSGLSANICVEPHPYLKIGRRVRIRSGPMAGLEGILKRKKDKFRLVLSIDLIMRSVAVEVDSADIEAIY